MKKLRPHTGALINQLIVCAFIFPFVAKVLQYFSRNAPYYKLSVLSFYHHVSAKNVICVGNISHAHQESSNASCARDCEHKKYKTTHHSDHRGGGQGLLFYLVRVHKRRRRLRTSLSSSRKESGDRSRWRTERRLRAQTHSAAAARGASHTPHTAVSPRSQTKTTQGYRAVFVACFRPDLSCPVPSWHQRGWWCHALSSSSSWWRCSPSFQVNFRLSSAAICPKPKILWWWRLILRFLNALIAATFNLWLARYNYAAGK